MTHRHPLPPSEAQNLALRSITRTENKPAPPRRYIGDPDAIARMRERAAYHRARMGRTATAIAQETGQ